MTKRLSVEQIVTVLKGAVAKLVEMA